MSELMNTTTSRRDFRWHLADDGFGSGAACVDLCRQRSQGSRRRCRSPDGLDRTRRSIWNMWRGRESHLRRASWSANSNSAVLQSRVHRCRRRIRRRSASAKKARFHFSRKIRIGFSRRPSAMAGRAISNMSIIKRTESHYYQISQSASYGPGEIIHDHREFCGHAVQHRGKSCRSRFFRGQGCRPWDVRERWFVGFQSRRSVCAVFVQGDVRCQGAAGFAFEIRHITVPSDNRF